ncbi:hypothetical protein ACFQ0Q_35175 [Streptomyces aureus]
MSGGLGSHMWGMVKHYRFAVHTPDQLWAMVESADGSTPADLGALLTSAAKTIKEIGDDLKTHSTAVEWDGEGGDAFRKWVHGAALATLSLGDYSEGAGKWMAHAADTLHEVKPQLEILKNSSASARSILDAHAAKATDVGNHVGGPSEASVTSAKSQYDNDSAEAAQLMIKLAQSYAASTEQIDALKAPEFPDMPKRFVPKRFDGNEDVGESPSTSSPNAGTAAAVGGVGVAAAGTAVVREAARGASWPEIATQPQLPLLRGQSRICRRVERALASTGSERFRPRPLRLRRLPPRRRPRCPVVPQGSGRRPQERCHRCLEAQAAPAFRHVGWQAAACPPLPHLALGGRWARQRAPVCLVLPARRVQ